MRSDIHMDFGGMQDMSATLGGLSVASAPSGLDLAPMRSDLVTSAALMLTEGWGNAVSTFEQTVHALSVGVDDTTNDFLSAEDAHITALAVFVDALDE